MSGTSRWLETLWYGRSWQRWLLLPLSLLFGLLTGIRRLAYRCHWLPSQRVPATVIVIGNITVGGTGKTPLLIALAQQLGARGFRVGIISRGYGGRAPVYPCAVLDDSDAALVGDEPLLIRRRTGLPVYVDPVRARAAQSLLKDHDCNLVLSDDGLQHYALARDFEVLVVDGARGFGNGLLLPAGPLREPPSRAATVDALVINDSGAASASPLPTVALQAHMQMQAARLINIVSGQELLPAQWAGARAVQAVAGIGNPQRFFRTLEASGFTLQTTVFPDHHAFQREDFPDGEDAIIMTEKDAVKVRAFAKPNWWYLAVDAILPDTFYEAIAQRVQQLQQRVQS